MARLHRAWARPAQSAAQSPAQSEGWSTVLPLRRNRPSGRMSVLLVLLLRDPVGSHCRGSGRELRASRLRYSRRPDPCRGWPSRALAAVLSSGHSARCSATTSSPCSSARRPRTSRARWRGSSSAPPSDWAHGLGWENRRVGAAAIGALTGALAGAVAVLLGGRLMLGSLALLTSDFPDSRLQVGQVGRLFGENGFGPVDPARERHVGGCAVQRVRRRRAHDCSAEAAIRTRRRSAGDACCGGSG